VKDGAVRGAEKVAPAPATATGVGGEEAAEAERCMVCLEDFSEGDAVRMLACMHAFHPPCVDKWLKMNNKCPICKHVVG